MHQEEPYTMGIHQEEVYTICHISEIKTQRTLFSKHLLVQGNAVYVLCTMYMNSDGYSHNEKKVYFLNTQEQQIE